VTSIVQPEVVTLVAQLNANWRVVVAHDGTEWILQRLHHANDWRPRTVCRSRPALENVVRAYAGDVDPAARAILDGLPANVFWPAKTAAPISKTKRPRNRGAGSRITSNARQL
jgi:hypothetical protein